MEETCARASSSHSGRDTTESSSQQSENIVLNMYMPCYTSFLASNITSPCFIFFITLPIF
jgi:hypothetical protein